MKFQRAKKVPPTPSTWNSRGDRDNSGPQIPHRAPDLHLPRDFPDLKFNSMNRRYAIVIAKAHRDNDQSVKQMVRRQRDIYDFSQRALK